MTLHPLAQAAAHRTLDAEGRVRRALVELDRQGIDITFVAVAARARVSRQFLYDHDGFRGEIEQLRTTSPQRTQARPARERASDDSLRTRLRAALDDNQYQREENTRLRDELAHALGRVRELELGSKIR
jgi:hypothetical protein